MSNVKANTKTSFSIGGFDFAQQNSEDPSRVLFHGKKNFVTQEYWVEVAQSSGTINAINVDFGPEDENHRLLGDGSLPWELKFRIPELISLAITAAKTLIPLKGVPTYQTLDGDDLSILKLPTHVTVNDDEIILDYGLARPQEVAIKPLTTISDGVSVDHKRGVPIANGYIGYDEYYTSRSGCTRAANASVTVPRDLAELVTDPRIESYQPLRHLELRLKELPRLVRGSCIPADVDSKDLPFQKWTFQPSEHMTRNKGFTGLLFMAKDPCIVNRSECSLEKVTPPDWALLPHGYDSDAAVGGEYLYSLSDGDLVRKELAYLQEELARAIWQVHGKEELKLLAEVETCLWRKNLPVKTGWEHKFLRQRSVSAEITSINPRVPCSTAARLWMAEDFTGKPVLVEISLDLTLGVDDEYVSLTELMDVLRIGDRNLLMAALEEIRYEDGEYSHHEYKSAIYRETFLRFPETEFALRFAREYGVAAFPALFASKYSALTTEHKYVGHPGTVEEVCKDFFGGVSLADPEEAVEAVEDTDY